MTLKRSHSDNSNLNNVIVWYYKLSQITSLVDYNLYQSLINNILQHQNQKLLKSRSHTKTQSIHKEKKSEEETNENFLEKDENPPYRYKLFLYLFKIYCQKHKIQELNIHSKHKILNRVFNSLRNSKTQTSLDLENDPYRSI